MENDNKIEKYLNAILAILVFSCIFSISFYAIRTSNDEWWHLKTGEYIIQHKFKLPKYDIFTYTAKDLEWVNHEWLSQVIFYSIYFISGLKGLIFFKSLVIVASFVILFFAIQKRAKNIYIALFVTLLAGLTSRHTLYPRPPIFSYLLMSIFLYFLYDIEENGMKKVYYFLFPILMILWSNLHGGAILGILLTAFFTVNAFLKKLIKSKETKPQVLHFIIIFLLTAIASLINPFGYKIHLLTFKVMQDRFLVEHIGELKSPDFHYTYFYEMMILLLLIAFATSLKMPTFTDIILILFFLHQSLNYVRHLPLFGIASASILGKHLSISWRNLLNAIEARSAFFSKSVNSFLIKHSDKIIFSLSIIFIFVFVIFIEGQWLLNYEALVGPGYRIKDYPVKAAEFILLNDFHGNMFNEINFAGYLIWRLYPKHLVFTDNRFDIFGSKFLPDFFTIMGVQPGWEQVLEKYKINFIITDRNSTLKKVLDKTDSWVHVYEDYGYAIYVKNIPENQLLISRALKTFSILTGEK